MDLPRDVGDGGRDRNLAAPQPLLEIDHERRAHAEDHDVHSVTPSPTVSAIQAARSPTTSGWIGRLMNRRARRSVTGSASRTAARERGLLVKPGRIVDTRADAPLAQPVAEAVATVNLDRELMVHRAVIGSRQGKGAGLGGRASTSRYLSRDLRRSALPSSRWSSITRRIAACSSSSAAVEAAARVLEALAAQP